ncbi:MAG: alpha-ribazole phosphatase [bacterium]|nr:alpha-ribazole phosphatase [bacterium]
MKMKNVTEILLIRHGQTDYNKNERFLGMTDISLNETGREQAARVGERLKDEKIDLVYCSDLKRCVETAEIIGFNKDIEYTSNLREMNFGKWEGLNWKELRDDFGDEFKSWRKDWVNYPVPGGESFKDMSARVIAEFEEIKKHENLKIAVVTHGGCIRTLLGEYLMDSAENSWKFYLENGTISRLCFNKGFSYLKSLNEI